MTTPASFRLEHFYFGQLVQDGKAVREARVLGASPGIKQEHVAECTQTALVPPLPRHPRGTWAILRARTVPYLFVQTQIGAAGQVVGHFILMPADVVRAYSGNLQSLMTLLHGQAPAFEKPQERMMPIELEEPQPPDSGQQTAAMLALMSATRDRIQTIEALLAGVISGTPVMIQGAPADLAERARFIEGLQALLPPPARPGVTFTTYATRRRHLDAVINFYSDDEPPENALVYRWQDDHTTGTKPTNDYARFITSQLRLDTAMVLEQTAALTPVAAWRIKLGDELADSLRYASYRLKLDHAVRDNQPAELDDVARTLTNDPTLTEDLQISYARHILKMALPMGEESYAVQVADMVRGKPDMEMALLNQLSETLASNGTLAEEIFSTVVSWMGRGQTFNGMFWTELAQQAAMKAVEALAEDGDSAALNAFMKRMAATPGAAHLTTIMPQVLDQTATLAERDADLALTILSQGIHSLSNDRLVQIMQDRALLAQLPSSVVRLQTRMFNGSSEPANGILIHATEVFEDEKTRDLFAVRMSELALLQGHPALVDAETLALLAQAADKPWMDQYDQTLRWIVRNLANERDVPPLGEGGARSLAHILLARRAFSDFPPLLLNLGKILFGELDQMDFAEFVRRVFFEAPLEPKEIQTALHSLPPTGIKPLPLMLAHYGALQKYDWATTLDVTVMDLSTLVVGNPVTAAQASMTMLLSLIKYHAAQGETTLALRVAELVPDIAIHEGETGITSMLRLCHMLRDDAELRAGAIDLLRLYVRKLPGKTDRAAAARLGQRLGGKVKDTLEATLLIKRVFQGLSLEDYAIHLHQTTELLRETAVAYVDPARAPGLKVLLGDLDALNGGLTDDDRHALSQHIIEMGRTIVSLAQRKDVQSPKDADEQRDALVVGSEDAATALDLLFVLGGYFSQGKRVKYYVEQTLSAHPLGTRSAPDLVRYTRMASGLLRTLLKIYPAQGERSYSTKTIHAELESLWNEIPLDRRRKIVQDLAQDFQRLSILIFYIANTGSSRVLRDDDRGGRKLETNQRKPESTLELYRFVSGYFSARMR
ncbi:MAG: hypothetical protein IT320_21260 [Anaerolineae bacterium]|nr:hypothetical protein [Anaerolineae bacterium]